MHEFAAVPFAPDRGPREGTRRKAPESAVRSAVPPSAPVRTAPSPIGPSILAGVVSWLGVVLALQAILETPELASAFVSSARWPGLVQALGGRITRIDDVLFATIPLISLMGVVMLGSVILVALVSFLGRAEGNRRLAAVAKRVSIAWLPLGGGGWSIWLRLSSTGSG